MAARGGAGAHRQGGIGPGRHRTRASRAARRHRHPLPRPGSVIWRDPLVRVVPSPPERGSGRSSVSNDRRFDDDYIAAPLTYAAAIAARTSRVRIGTAIVIAPLHHPAEIAEQAAMVDLVSNGRLDLGIGAGYRVPEYELFGASLQRRYAQTDERAREIRRLWAPGGVTPRPVQDPPPIWMGYQGPQGARRAGLLGESLLSADAALWEPYRAGLAEAGHDVAAARMAGGIQAWVSEDPEAVAARIFDFVGDAPVETVFLWASVGGQPEETVARHIQTVCTRLAPILAAGRPAKEGR
ncbi:LLM class flavin-dependent oxidoreductase [Frankia canadensis]|uniref:LLM class flavin-dependent oxidoreductase n=1 Tax=Frankia canadensis TaxID=1836972 RepID=UPI003C2B8AB1